MKNRYHPYAAVTIVCWSLAYVLTRLTLPTFTPFSLGFLRYLIASCTLAVVAIITKMKPPRRTDLPWFFASGAAGFCFYMIAFNQGQATVTAATGSVVIATVPVITAALARVVYGEIVRPLQWVAIGVGLSGVGVLTWRNGGFSFNAGLVWLLLAALALSVYNLLQRKLTAIYSPLQTTTYSIFFGTVMLAVFAPASIGEICRAPAIQLGYLVILGVFSSAIAYVSWAKAFSLAKQTSLVSNYMFFTPFLTSLLGFLLAGEAPGWRTLVGGGIILTGVFLFRAGKV